MGAGPRRTLPADDTQQRERPSDWFSSDSVDVLNAATRDMLLGGSAALGVLPRRLLRVFARSGYSRKVLAAVLASTHAPLLALLGHCAFVSASGRRAPGSAVALTLGATVVGSAVSVLELRRLDRTMRSLAELSSRDPLTGVYNRHAGEERLAGDLARVARDGSTMMLVALDLDGLKETNDSLGHAAGDELIRRVADALSRNLREGDWIARWGGDEFVSGLWDVADPETATRVLERVDRELREMPLPHSSYAGAKSPEPPPPTVAAESSVSLRPSFSAGVVVCEPGEDPGRCLARADALLYEAKRRGQSEILHEPRGKGGK